jgi:hypothetical protein
VLLGCKSNSEEISVDTLKFSMNDLVTDSLKGKYLGISDSIGVPTRIQVVNVKDEGITYGLIADFTKKPPLHYVDLTNDSYLNKVSREGRGPGEFLNVYSLLLNKNNRISVLDERNLRITEIDLNESEDLSELYNFEPQMLSIEMSGLPLEVFKTDKNGEYIALGLLQTDEIKNFAILDSTGKEIGFKGKFPSYIDTTLPNRIHQLAWRSYSTPNYKRSRFAIGYLNNDLIDIYNSSGKIIKKIKGPNYKQLEYGAENGRLSLNQNTNKAYIDLTTTKNYLYALYSGKELSDHNRNHGTHIFVFKWNGDLVKHYVIDKLSFGISVDEINEKIYITAPQSERPGVYVYDIQNLVR